MSFRTFSKGNQNEHAGQRFLFSFAQMWGANYDQEKRCMLVKNDVHALPNYRVNKAVNALPEYFELFRCKQNTLEEYVMFGE